MRYYGSTRWLHDKAASGFGLLIMLATYLGACLTAYEIAVVPIMMGLSTIPWFGISDLHWKTAAVVLPMDLGRFVIEHVMHFMKLVLWTAWPIQPTGILFILILILPFSLLIGAMSWEGVQTHRRTRLELTEDL